MRRYVLGVVVVLFACFALPELADAEPAVTPPAAEVTTPGDDAPAAVSRRRKRRHRKARKTRKARKHHKARAKR